MAGPWEKYQRRAEEPAADNEPDGPWKKYRQEAAPSPAAGKPPEWSDLPGNIIPSAVQMAKDVAQPILHPIETAKALGDVAGGVAAKVGIGDHDQTAADNVGQFFVERYGGLDNMKRTMIQDPVGFVGDIATVLTGGSTLAARAPGAVGTIARGAGAVGNAIDPLNAAAKAVSSTTGMAGRGAAWGAGLSTGTGSDAVRGMERAGREGNVSALEQMRDRAPIEDLYDTSMNSLGQMADARARQYDIDMAPARADNTVLSFAGIDRAVADALDKVQFKGVAKNADAVAVIGRMSDAINEWKALNPADYHTPMGFDALKQRLGAIREGTEAGTQSRLVADDVYRRVKDDIEAQVPQYATAMRAYQNASEELNEIRKTLSLREGATKDTAIRKLLTTTRNNVNTNFGTRQKLVEQLARYDPSLPGMLYGRAMSGAQPMGLARPTAMGLGAGGLMTAGMTMNPLALGVTGAGLAASSPRLIGETAYKVGQARRALDRLTSAQRRLLLNTSFQTGRAERTSKEKGRGR